MSASRKQYYNPEEAPLWITAHKRRPEFSRDYIVYWLARYGFVLLVCFFVALVLTAITILPDLRNNRSLLASLDSLQQSFEIPAEETASAPIESPASEETLFLNVASEPSGQTVYIDFDSVGVTPLYRQRLIPGVYVVSAGFSFDTRRDTVLVATDTDSRWLLFGEDQTIAYRDTEGADDEPAIEGLDANSGFTQAQEANNRPSSVQSTPGAEIETSRTPSVRQPQSTTSQSVSEPNPTTNRRTTNSNAEGGTLVFRSDPPGALVLLDNVLVGTTPLTLVGVPAGNHKIAIKKDGFIDYDTSFNVENSESFVVEAALESSIGYIVVLVEPWGSIYIDGKLYKLETDIEYTTEISAGRHIVTATHPTLGSISREVVVSGGDRERVTLSFEGQQ